MVHEPQAQPARTGTASTLRFHTREVQDVDAFDFFARLGPGPRTLIVRDGDGLVGGAGPEAILRPGEDLHVLRDRTMAYTFHHDRDPGVPEDVGPVWLGALPFDGAADAPFRLPLRLLTARGGRTYLTEAAPAEARPSVPSPPLEAVAWRPDPPFDVWAERSREALRAIHAGSLEKVVLARRLVGKLAGVPDLAAIARRLAQRSPTSWTYVLAESDRRAWIGASPELLVRCRDGRLDTVALAGSRPRGRTPADDEALARSLRTSSKEAWEHELVVRHLRRVLEARGAPWRVTRDRDVAVFPNVQHLETRMESSLEAKEHVLDLVRAFHPTPAVAGSPPTAALEVLRRLEEQPREYYGGAVGWFNAVGEGEFFVALRCARLTEGEATLFAGCGIVSGSDPTEEWEESAAKLRLMVEAFQESA